MKRLLSILFFVVLLTVTRAQTIYWWDYPMNVGSLTTNNNQSFSNILPFVQSAYSNAHVVTHQASETNFLQWVSRSSDGKTNYWLACFTNGGGGTGASTPQGPWTNWIAGSTFGVSNAGTYRLADTNTTLVALGTNVLTVQGGASTPTNIAWNGNSLWSVGGGSGGGNVTNTWIGFHIVYADAVETNYIWANGTTTNMQLVINATNVIYDGGTGSIGRAFVDATNGIFYAPVGYNCIYLDASDGAGPSAGYDEPIWLQVNQGNASSAYWGASALNSSEYSEANRISAIYATGLLKGQKLFYNTAATNKWRLFGKQSSGGVRYNFNKLDLRLEYRGPRP